MGLKEMEDEAKFLAVCEHLREKKLPEDSRIISVLYESEEDDVLIVERKPKKQKTLDEFHQRIRVCVSKRPLSEEELANQETDIVTVGAKTIEVNVPR